MAVQSSISFNDEAVVVWCHAWVVLKDFCHWNWKWWLQEFGIILCSFDGNLSWVKLGETFILYIFQSRRRVMNLCWKLVVGDSGRGRTGLTAFIYIVKRNFSAAYLEFGETFIIFYWYYNCVAEAFFMVLEVSGSHGVKLGVWWKWVWHNWFGSFERNTGVRYIFNWKFMTWVLLLASKRIYTYPCIVHF